MKRHWTLCAAVIGMFFILPMKAEADCLEDFYLITKVTDNLSSPFIYFGNPSINNAEMVAFVGHKSGGGESLLTGSGDSIPTLNTIADTSGPLSDFGLTPAINDAGTVAFWALADAGGQAILTYNGGQFTFVAIAGSPYPFKGLGLTPAINNAGTVAFIAFGDAGWTGVLTSSSGQPPGEYTTVADNQGFFSQFGLTGPVISDSGTVAFKGWTDAGWHGVFTSSSGSLYTIKDTSDGSFDFLGKPSISQSGAIAFVAQGSTGWNAILTGSGSTVVSNGGQFASFGGVSVNNAGMVAFLGYLDAGGHGIFTSEGKKVIQTGDPLDGSTVTFLGLSHQGFNDNGVVAFYAELANGRRGIYRAAPFSVSNCTSVTWQLGIVHYNPRTRRYEQRVTLTNDSRERVAGPIWLVLDDLSPYVRLFNASGRLSPHSPYVEVAGREGLASGASVSVLLEFVNPSRRAISYRPRVLAGSGAR